MTRVWLLACVLATAWLLWSPGDVAAQADTGASSDTASEEDTPALLIADTIFVTPDNELIAEGNVEMLYEGRTLRASRVIYDRSDDSLRLEGPLRIEDPDGTIVLSAEAEVDAGFRNGVLRGARLVLDGQLQMASVQLARLDGRYSVLTKPALTSCQICFDDRAPLWEIRARQAVHDEEERQIYLDQATLRVLDVPVFYVPRLRLPDSTVDRARGFLFPEIVNSTKLGIGLRLPYFIPLGDHRDITVAPYVSPITATVEYRYRQAFVRGDVEVLGALSRDTIRENETHGFLFVEGAFDAGRDFELEFDAEFASDESYLRDYGYSRKSRLDSAISLTRVSRDEVSRGEVIFFRSLRGEEDPETQPGVLLDVVRNDRIFPSFGGELRLGARVHGHYRRSDVDVDGRDVYRATTSALWRDSWVASRGVHVAVQGGVAIDAVRNLQDSLSASEDVSAAPFVAATLRYPLVAAQADGMRYSLEPVAQLSWTGGDALETANDESTRSEFDEGHLLALSRFSTSDRRERGGALAMGLRWGVQAPSGWRGGLTLGRVLREETRSGFSPTSGLSNANSDWLIVTELGRGTGLDFIGRALFDEDRGDINRGELRTQWSNAVVDLTAAYILLPADDVEERDDRVAEWSFRGDYQFTRHWLASVGWQYDLELDRSAAGELGLEYQNECVVARLEAELDFADEGALDPTTTVGFSVDLLGFGTGGNAGGYARQCSN